MRATSLTTHACTLLVIVIFTSTAVATSALEPTQPVPFRVAVIASETPTSNIIHLTDLLWHLGYPYDYVNVDSALPDLSRYSLVIIYQEGFSRLTAVSSAAVSEMASYRGSLLWIGTGIGAMGSAASEIFGVQFKNEDFATNLGVAFARYGTTKTVIANENVTQVELTGAIVDGYFIDNNSETLFPAETHLQRGLGNFAYYFAYDVSDWWKADPDLPWSRPAILVSAIRAALVNAPNVLLRAYPENMDTLYVVRIEDVDPLHNAPEWLNRAQEFLQYSTGEKIPLAIALIPVYVDPSNGLNVPLNADSAGSLRDWLQEVVLRGGTIIQHGYTHQYGSLKTGAGTEFLLNGTWMSYGDQFQRIKQGKDLLDGSLPTKIVAFEAPHYKANNDTILAISRLGFKYYFDDPNSPFFGFQSSGNGDAPLVVFPETLSYVPLNASMNFETWVKASVDQLRGFGGILLQYNHLYDDTAYTIGIDSMNYVMQRGHVWTPTIDAAGRFELDRASSYKKFSVTTGSEATVILGAFPEYGLTISINGGRAIQWVQVNGKQWSLFGKDYVILPPLLGDRNTVTVGFDQSGTGQAFPLPFGLIVSAIATAVAYPLARKMSDDAL